MFRLCIECRKAFNFTEDDTTGQTSTERVPRDVATANSSVASSNVSEKEDLRLSGRTEDTCAGPVMVGESAVTSNRSEEAPVCKRVRIEDSLITEHTLLGEDQGAPPSMRVRDVGDSNAVEDPVSCQVEDIPASMLVKETCEGDLPCEVHEATAGEGGRDVKGENTDASVSPVCSACLGLLDDSFIDSLTADISEELVRADYECLKTFCLSISTPLSLIIRRCGVLFYLSEEFELSDELTPPQEAYVKESLRHKLYSKLKAKLDPLKGDIESPFQIIVKVDHSSAAVECRLASETWPDAFSVTRKTRKRRRGRGKGKEASCDSDSEQTIINTASVTAALSSATAADFENGDFLYAAQPCTYSIDFSHAPLYVGGQYCKFSRDLPQTPWFIAGIRKAETSVQELICDPIQHFTRSTDVRFSSAGREDCDVRMLGHGRPFLAELFNPRKTALDRPEIAALQAKINSSTDLVEVKQLQVMTKSAAAFLKEGEEEKKKEYSALVWAPEELTQEMLDSLGEMKDTVIQQKTPIRVLHRRSLATRARTIHTMRGELVDDHHFYLHLTTQAGTYIKEFVHGDFGRTQPNLRSIMGQEVDILTLDVCQVLLEWPPPT